MKKNIFKTFKFIGLLALFVVTYSFITWRQNESIKNNITELTEENTPFSNMVSDVLMDSLDISNIDDLKIISDSIYVNDDYEPLREFIKCNIDDISIFDNIKEIINEEKDKKGQIIKDLKEYNADHKRFITRYPSKWVINYYN